MNLRRIVFGSLTVMAVAAVMWRLMAGRTPARAEHVGAGYNQVNAYIDAEMGNLNIPGAALAIVEGDEIVHLQGFGRARPGGDAPAPQTPFVLGSLTKSFTALAVMQLVEAGRVDLDAPVQQYLPWFRVADAEASGQITVRRLLNQTSGIPQIPGVKGLTDFDQGADAAERQARALASLQLAHPVGTTFEYSNLNFNLLGLVIEAASGESYSDYVQGHIFDPLAMTHSYTTQAAAQRDGLAVGHTYWFTAPVATPNLPMPRGSLASGQLMASSEDMAHYLIAHLNAGRFGESQLVSPAGMNALLHPAVGFDQVGFGEGHYAMGWFVNDSGDTPVVWHYGTVPDFFAYMALLPERNQALVLLVNANHLILNDALVEVGHGAVAALAGQPHAPVPVGLTVLILRLLPIIPVLQVLGAALTLRQVWRWRQDPRRRPGKRTLWLQHIGLPAVLNLLVATPLVGLLATGMLRVMLVFTPDIGWISLISGGAALVWGTVRSWLLYSTWQAADASTLPDGRVQPA